MISPVDSIKNIIAPSRWKLLEADDLPMLPDGSLRRYIDEVDRATAHKVADYLRAYTDVANAASAKPYVDNPTIEGTVRTGRFRGGRVSVEEIPTPRPNTPPIRIIQTLLWNCLETLPDEHARLVEGRYLPANPVTDKGDGHGAERWYTLRWANVAPDLAHSLAAGIGLSASATDKKYRKWDGSSTVTLTGTYYPVFGRAGTADDGSAFVEVLYAQSRFSVTVKDNLGVWNESNTLIHYGVPKILAQGIITDWETANPKGSRVNIDRAADTSLCTLTLMKRVYSADVLADQITADNCDAKETTSTYWGLEESALSSHVIPASEDIPAGTAWRRQVSNNGDGSFDVVLTKVETKLRDISVFTGYTDASQSITVKQFKGVTDRVTHLGAYLDAPSAGQSRRWNMQKRDDCSEDWVVETTTATPMPFNATITAAHKTANAVLQMANVRGGRNLTSANVATLQALVDAAAVQGVVYRLDKKQNDDGSWDVTVTKAESQALDIAEHQTLTSMLAEGNTVAGRNLRDAAVATLQALVDAAAVQGVVYRLEKSPNEDGSWDVTVTKAESQALDIAEHQTLTSMLAEGNTVAGRNLRDAAVATLQALVDAAAVQGVVYRLEKSPNEDGSWDVTVTKAESQALDIADHRTLTSMLAEGNTVAGRNLRDAAVATLQALVDAAAVQGVVYRLEKSPNDDGSWDVTVTKAESQALDIAEHQTLTSMLAEGNTVAGRNLRDAAVATLQALVDAAAVQGVVYRLEKSPNEDGSWDVTVTKAESQALDIAEHQTLTSMLAEGNTVAGRNLRDAAVATLQALVDAAAVQGVVYRLEKSPNDDGSWDVTVTKAESQALDIAEHQTLTSMLAEGNTVAGRNLRDAAVATLQALVDAAAVQGVVYRLEKSPNEDGSWDVTVTKAESQALDIADHRTLTSMLAEGNTVAGRNLRDAAVATLQALVDAAAVQGVVYRLEKSPNDDGSWDVTVTKAESQALDIAEHQTLTSMLAEGNTVAGRNLRDAAVATLQALVDAAAVQGVVYRLEKSPNEDGSWDVTVTKAESQALNIASHKTLVNHSVEQSETGGRNLRDSAVATLQAMVASAMAGKELRLVKTVREDGTWDVEVVESTAKPQRTTYTYTDADGEVHGISAQNVDAATKDADYAGIPDESKASASPPRLNAFGLYDYTVEWRVLATTIRSAHGWTTGTEIIDAGQDDQGRAVIYEIGYYLERGDAYTFASDALSAVGYTKMEMGLSAVQTMGPGKWVGRRRGVSG